jgi:hypothetical protein
LVTRFELAGALCCGYVWDDASSTETRVVGVSAIEGVVEQEDEDDYRTKSFFFTFIVPNEIV